MLDPDPWNRKLNAFRIWSATATLLFRTETSLTSIHHRLPPPKQSAVPTWRSPLAWYSRRLRCRFCPLAAAGGAASCSSRGPDPSFSVLYRADILASLQAWIGKKSSQRGGGQVQDWHWSMHTWEYSDFDNLESPDGCHMEIANLEKATLFWLQSLQKVWQCTIFRISVNFCVFNTQKVFTVNITSTFYKNFEFRCSQSCSKKWEIRISKSN